MEPYKIMSHSGTRYAKEVYPIERILPLVSESVGSTDLDGDHVFVYSLRLRCFAEHGVVCVGCGLRGEFFRKERHSSGGTYHLNMYGRTPEGYEVLMTRDHIIELGKGGPDCIENLQTMCFFCNQRKNGSIDIKSGPKEASSHVWRNEYTTLSCHVLAYHHEGEWIPVRQLQAEILSMYPWTIYSSCSFDKVLAYDKFKRRTDYDEVSGMIRYKPMAVCAHLARTVPSEDLYAAYYTSEMPDVLSKGFIPMVGSRNILKQKPAQMPLGLDAARKLSLLKYRNKGNWLRVKAVQAHRDGAVSFSRTHSGAWIVMGKIPPAYLEDAGYINDA